MENKRNFALDFIKFLASIVIALLHYNWRIVPQGYLCVEFFFVSSGFLIYKRRCHYSDRSFFFIALGKIKSFGRYYIILVVLAIFLHISNRDMGVLQNFPAKILQFFLFLPYIFTGGGYTLPFGHVWFLPCWLVGSLILIYFLKMKYRSENIMIALISLVLFGLVYTATDFHGINMSLEKAIFCFTFGFSRALLDMSMGIVFSKISERLQIRNTFCANSLVVFVLIFSLYIFTLSANPAYDFISIFLFGILILLLNEKELGVTSILSKLGKRLNVLVSLSLPIYVFHVPCIKLLQILGFENRLRFIPLYMAIVLSVTFIDLALRKLFHCDKNKKRRL